MSPVQYVSVRWEEEKRCSDIMCVKSLGKVSTTESEAVDNLLLTAASSSNPAETNETHTCNSCDEDNLAKSWCADCEEHLCGDCEKAHLRVKITRDHKVKAIVAPPKVSVTNPENKEAFLKVPTHCKTHPVSIKRQKPSFSSLTF